MKNYNSFINEAAEKATLADLSQLAKYQSDYLAKKGLTPEKLSEMRKNIDIAEKYTNYKFRGMLIDIFKSYTLTEEQFKEKNLTLKSWKDFIKTNIDSILYQYAQCDKIRKILINKDIVINSFTSFEDNERWYPHFYFEKNLAGQENYEKMFMRCNYDFKSDIMETTKKFADKLYIMSKKVNIEYDSVSVQRGNANNDNRISFCLIIYA